MPSAISLLVFPGLPYMTTPAPSAPPSFVGGHCHPVRAQHRYSELRSRIPSTSAQSLLDLIPAHAGIQPRRSRPAIQRFLDSRPGLLAAGVTFFRGNDGDSSSVRTKIHYCNYEWRKLSNRHQVVIHQIELSV
jgi:hypothetical protein